MKKTFLAVSFLALSLGGCAGTSSTAAFTSEPVEQSDVQWSLVDSVDLEAISPTRRADRFCAPCGSFVWGRSSNT